MLVFVDKPAMTYPWDAPWNWRKNRCVKEGIIDVMEKSDAIPSTVGGTMTDDGSG